MKLLDVHQTIGKILTIICIAFVIVAIIGIPFGLTRCSKLDDTPDTNNFLYENISIHDDNYSVIVNNTYSANTITILDSNNQNIEMEGFFICVDITISQKENSTKKKHVIDSNDFKLKNHTGVYIPLNSIMGALGWDAIDIHFDEKDGGHVMSSTDFDTLNSVKDYNYIDKEMVAGASFDFIVYFKMLTDIKVEENLTVLEIDFFRTNRGTDVVLLPRPNVNNE